MRLVMIKLLATLATATSILLVTGCDSGSAPKGQGQGAVKQAAAPKDNHKPADKGPDIALISSNGAKAMLTYAFAGTKAPAVQFAGADGRDVVLSDFAGRPLLVNLWATWCAPCKAEMPTLDALAMLEEGKKSVIVISQDLEGKARVTNYFAKAGLKNLEPYTDPENQMSFSLGGNVALPTTILYDSQGKEVWRVIGGVEWDDAEMAKLLGQAG